jgi:AcrR family transcriptional regulator
MRNLFFERRVALSRKNGPCAAGPPEINLAAMRPKLEPRHGGGLRVPSIRKRAHAVTEEAIAERRTTILDHAALLIARHGVDGFSFAALAQATGYSVGMLQHYYRTRERLIHAAVAYRMRASVQEWEGIYARDANAIERIHDLLTFSVSGELAFAEAWGFRVQVYAAAHKDQRIRGTVAEVLLAWRGLFVGALAEAGDEGLTRPGLDAEELAELLIALIDGMAIQTLLGFYGSSPGRMTDSLHRFAAREMGIDVDEFVHNKAARPAR